MDCVDGGELKLLKPLEPNKSDETESKIPLKMQHYIAILSDPSQALKYDTDPVSRSTAFIIKQEISRQIEGGKSVTIPLPRQ